MKKFFPVFMTMLLLLAFLPTVSAEKANAKNETIVSENDRLLSKNANANEKESQNIDELFKSIGSYGNYQVYFLRVV